MKLVQSSIACIVLFMALRRNKSTIWSFIRCNIVQVQNLLSMVKSIASNNPLVTGLLLPQATQLMWEVLSALHTYIKTWVFHTFCSEIALDYESEIYDRVKCQLIKRYGSPSCIAMNSFYKTDTISVNATRRIGLPSDNLHIRCTPTIDNYTW